jgi:hypothetical protein
MGSGKCRQEQCTHLVLYRKPKKSKSKPNKRKTGYTFLNHNHQTLKAFGVFVAGCAAHRPAAIFRKIAMPHAGVVRRLCRGDVPTHIINVGTRGVEERTQVILKKKEEKIKSHDVLNRFKKKKRI